ncbi:cytochrome P450 4C1-like [Photinus pyralis]|uniref:cytochrome P450 4C1-like n=1 Tax=Photinus pyralis TaxID=7054 RepID=UPI00126737F4|nr:cytochrome P450 4C1-like [Photinus pyralis]
MLEAIDYFAPKSALQTLVIVALVTFLVWYTQYHWNRRRLYKMASRFDGPISLPFIGSGLSFVGSTSDILNNVMVLFQTFKPPVRVWLGQKLFYALFDPEDLEIIMNNPHALEKDELYLFAEPFVGTGLFTAPVPKWKRHRKVIMPTFNQRILDEFVPVFAEQSEILLEQLKKQVGKGSFDIFQLVSRCTLDIICETAMGVKVEAQTTDSDYVKWANKAMEITFTRMFNIWYHFDSIFNLTQSARDLLDIQTKMKTFTGAVVRNKREAYQTKMRERRQLPEGYVDKEAPTRKTFLQQLIELSEGGANFTDDELREEVDTFMVAGSDTTASMNSFIFVMLGMYPDVQEEVYQEVLDVLGPDRAVEAADLGRFQYMERVMKETMRIFPVGPLLVRAITKDIQLENCVIPAGSSVVTVIMQTHRSEKIWPQPLKFEPDRFLPEEIAKRHPYAWLPFSAGPRNCVGPKYAFMAMKALIATVVRRYKFTTDYKSIEDIKLKADLMLKPVDGYNVSAELRE